MRIVSLVPSASEIVCLLGGHDHLVGRSHECDFPRDLSHRPVLTAQHTAADFSQPQASPGVDKQVRAATAAGTPLYTLNADLLRSLQPDLIITQDLCGVCSIDLDTVRSVVADLARAGSPAPAILSLNPATLEDVLDDVLRVGEAIDAQKRAEREAVALRERLYRAQEFVNPYEEGPVVGFLEWTDPLFVAGHWTVQMIERAGGRHPLNETIAREGAGAAAGLQQGARTAGPSIRVPPEVFAATRPDAIVIAPCGLNLEQTRAQTRALAEQDWFRDMPAVRAGRIALVDGNQHFNRPGPRLVDAFEWLVGWLQHRPALIPTNFPWERRGS